MIKIKTIYIKYLLKNIGYIVFILISVMSYGQDSSSYNDESKFGWDNVITLSNKYITVTTVPATGRTLEFNLNEHPFLWKNSNMFGKSFSHNDSLTGMEWRNFGGHRITLLPRTYTMNKNGDWKGRWPPPAIIGASPYTLKKHQSKHGKIGFTITSNEQVLPSPLFSDNQFYQAQEKERLVYSRTMHIENGSSKVYITHRLKNAGNNSVERGMLAICQHVSNHKKRDGHNFWVYFPIDDKYKITDTSYAVISTNPERLWKMAKKKLNLTEADTIMKAHYTGMGKHYRGEIIPGIYGMHYDYVNMSGLHSISTKGWVAYVDELKGKTMVRLFEPFDSNKTYDLEANLSIYNSSVDEGYLETELMTPIVNIPPGEETEFSEVWCATTCYGPIIDVTNSGAVTNYLHFNSISGLVGGRYGVFNKGYLVLKMYDESGNELYTTKLQEVSPSEVVNVRHIVKFIPNNIKRIKLLIHDHDDNLIGILDNLDL